MRASRTIVSEPVECRALGGKYKIADWAPSGFGLEATVEYVPRYVHTLFYASCLSSMICTSTLQLCNDKAVCTLVCIIHISDVGQLTSHNS